LLFDHCQNLMADQAKHENEGDMLGMLM